LIVNYYRGLNIPYLQHLFLPLLITIGAGLAIFPLANIFSEIEFEPEIAIAQQLVVYFLKVVNIFFIIS